MMDLPLTTGPIFLFLATDQGPRFAAGASVGILFGLIGLAAFAVAYALSSSRVGWVGCLSCFFGRGQLARKRYRCWSLRSEELSRFCLSRLILKKRRRL